MKKGKIIEKGNHDELLKNYPNGTYAKFVNDQQNAEDENEDAEQEEDKNDSVAINVDFKKVDLLDSVANNEPKEELGGSIKLPTIDDKRTSSI